MSQAPQHRNDGRDDPGTRLDRTAPGRDAETDGRQHEPAPHDDHQDTPDKPEHPRRRSWRLWAIIIGSAVVLAAIAAWLFIPWRTTVSTDDAFIGADTMQVSPRVAGRVDRVLITDNQLVGAGDLLVELDPADYHARTEQARAAVALAQSQVAAAQAREQQAEAETVAAQAESSRATADLARYEQLGPGAISEQQRDLAIATERSAQARLTAAQRTAVAAQADIEQARAQVRQAQAALAVAQLQESYTAIRAPAAGRVTNRAIAVGDYVREGQVILALVPAEVYVLANFKETQLTRMRSGQSATIRIDAYPDTTFAGHVDSIQSGSGAAFSLLPPENATGNYVKVVQRVPVKIVFDQPPDPAQFVLGPGMSVVPKVKVK